jgi:hypothetical protein
LLAAGVSGVVVVVIGLALFQPWKLWIDDTVDEAAPLGAVPIAASTTTAAPPVRTAVPTLRDSTTTPSTHATTAAPERTAPATSAPAPATSDTSVAPVTTFAGAVAPAPLGGEFASIDHGTTGTVVLLEDATGAQFVRLEELDTSNGPDLFVYLSTNPAEGAEGEFDDDYVNLGRLEGNVGSSNYPIPAGTDLSRYASVVIWCDRFNSAFGAAPLH